MLCLILCSIQPGLVCSKFPSLEEMEWQQYRLLARPGLGQLEALCSRGHRHTPSSPASWPSESSALRLTTDLSQSLPWRTIRSFESVCGRQFAVQLRRLWTQAYTAPRGGTAFQCPVSPQSVVQFINGRPCFQPAPEVSPPILVSHSQIMSWQPGKVG